MQGPYTADRDGGATGGGRPVSAGDQRLRSIVDRIVRLEGEKRDLASDIKDIFQEAKSAGYDVKALRVTVKRHMETPEQTADRKLVENTVELMEAALGTFSDTPLAQHAISGVRAAVERLDAMVDRDGIETTISSGGKTISFGRKGRAARAAAAEARA